MNDFKKLVTIGQGSSGLVYVTIDFKSGVLSITAVEGPRGDGNCLGSAGQCIDSIKNDITYGLMKIDSASISLEDSVKLLKIWDEWHLNDLQAGCEHQMALGWNEMPIDASKPLRDYGKFSAGQLSNSYNMLVWVNVKEHHEGLLSRPCPVCAYEYGTEWKRVEVPESVLEFLQSLKAAIIPDRLSRWFR